MNQKDLRIKKLWEKGLRDPAKIARKIGYQEINIAEGVERVKDALKRTNCV